MLALTLLACLPTSAAAAKDYSVKVRAKGSELVLSVSAANTPLATLARELEKEIKVPVVLSRLMHGQRTTVNFTDLPLFQGLQRLAARPTLDYAVGGGDAGPPQPIGIYLSAVNEAAPAAAASFKNAAETFLVEGHTEGAPAPPDRQPLWVSYVNGRLSLRAKKQPLGYVLAQVAERVGVPFELRRDSDDLVDLELNNQTLEQAVRSLGRGAQLYLRIDSVNTEGRPLRILSGKAK